jgi:hypothetical protein
MKLLVVGAWCCLMLYGTCSKRDAGAERGLDVTGQWNVASYHTYDSISYNFISSVFSFGSDSSCIIPRRAEIDFVLDNGQWRLLDSTRMELHVNDTLLSGVWSIGEIRYSSVKDYRSTILSMTMCHERNSLCFTLRRDYQPPR